MAFKIGFSVSEEKEKMSAPEPPDVSEEREPRRSVVRVQFPQRNMTLAYYNDRFDLHCGDLVYVDGKLEGKRGRVVDVNYNFRINLADYKRVIGVADTNVSGRFTLAGSHVLTFDRAALPRRKVMSWYKAPSKPDTEYACGSDGSTFPLRELHAHHRPPRLALFRNVRRLRSGHLFLFLRYRKTDLECHIALPFQFYLSYGCILLHRVSYNQDFRKNTKSEM